MLLLSFVSLVLGFIFYFYGSYIKKTPSLLIQNSFNLSNKNFSVEAIQLYANKISRITRIFSVFLIVFSLIQYFVDNVEFSLIVMFVSLFLYPFCCFYCQKVLTEKMPTALIISMTILFMVVFLFMVVAYIESDISIDDENIKISGIYSEEIPLNKLCTVFLADTLPTIGNKANGFSTGRINKGYFYSKSLGKNVKLFLHSKSQPYIYIVYANNKYVIVNFYKQEITLQVYDKLKGVTENE